MSLPPARPNGTGHDRDGLGEILGLMQLLWGLDHALHATSKRMAVGLGVTGPQRLVIRIVGQHPGITAGELARILRVHPSTLTGVLRRLETRKILKRVPDRADRRRAFLQLTPKGQRVNQTRSGTVEAAVRRAAARVPKEDLAAGRRLLRALEAELDGKDRTMRRQKPELRAPQATD